VPVSEEYLAYVLEQLAGMGHLTSRRMFGGAGIYCGGLFFALIFRDQLYFKVDDTNRSEYEKLGMERFRPYADRPHLSMTYYTVPVEVLEDNEQLTEWGRRAVAAALNSTKAKPSARTGGKRTKATTGSKRPSPSRKQKARK
jgi:DNA transformation protein